MPNKINLPGFIKEGKENETGFYNSAHSFNWFSENSLLVVPQYRSHVQRACGPCKNGKKLCSLVGLECTARLGVPGDPDLGIPPSGGSVQCVPEVFSTTVVSC